MLDGKDAVVKGDGGEDGFELRDEEENFFIPRTGKWDTDSALHVRVSPSWYLKSNAFFIPFIGTKPSNSLV